MTTTDLKPKTETIVVLHCSSCNESRRFYFNGRYNPAGKPIYVCPCCGEERSA